MKQHFFKKIKELINEITFNSGFNKVKPNDILSVVTNKSTLQLNVISIQGTQMLIEFQGRKYILVSNSLDGDKLTAFERVNGQNKKITIKDVKHIIVKRNGNTVSVLTATGSTSTNFTNFDDDDDEDGIEIDEIFDNCVSILGVIEVDDRITIKIGEMINELKMKPEPIGFIQLHARQITDKGVIVCAVTDSEGTLNPNLAPIQNGLLAFSTKKSLERNDNGVVLNIRNKNSEDFFIEQIFSIERDKYFNIDEPSFDELMRTDKNFRNLMHKEPSLMNKFMGMQAKGVFPANDIMKKLGLEFGHFTQGKKVRFKWLGPKIVAPNTKPNNDDSNLDGGQILGLAYEKEYVGMFSTSRSIKLTGIKRGESIIILLKKQGAENYYDVSVEFRKIANGREKTKTLGSGVIKIKDINFR